MFSHHRTHLPLSLLHCRQPSHSALVTDAVMLVIAIHLWLKRAGHGQKSYFFLTVQPR